MPPFKITRILDNGATLDINIGYQVRSINKSQIKDISVAKGNLIRIDIGEGPLEDIFIPYANVSDPVTDSPQALVAATTEFLMPVPSGGESAAYQESVIANLEEINNNTNNTGNKVDTVLSIIGRPIAQNTPILLANETPDGLIN